MTATNQFGVSVGRADIRAWIRGGLALWLPTYLREAEREQGYTVGRTALPNTWRVAERIDKWPEEMLPAVIIQLPGLIGEPERIGGGIFVATWAVALTGIVRGRSSDDSEAIADVYALALRNLMLQKAAIDDWDATAYTGPTLDVMNVIWADEGYDPLPQRGRSRTLVAATVTFRVSMRGLADEYGGPAEPLPTPTTDPGPWPLVDETIVTADNTSEEIEP